MEVYLCSKLTRVDGLNNNGNYITINNRARSHVIFYNNSIRVLKMTCWC